MSVYGQITAAVAVGGALLLLAGGVGQLRSPRQLASMLAAQRLTPRWSHRPLAGVVAVAEAGVGATAVTGWLTGWAPAGYRLSLVAVALVGVALVYAVFGGYTAVLRIRRPGSPCGCVGGGAAVSWGVVARAWVFCVAAAMAAPAVDADAATADRLGVGCAAVLIALIAWMAPQLGGIARPARRNAP